MVLVFFLWREDDDTEREDDGEKDDREREDVETMEWKFRGKWRVRKVLNKKVTLVWSGSGSERAQE